MLTDELFERGVGERVNMVVELPGEVNKPVALIPPWKVGVVVVHVAGHTTTSQVVGVLQNRDITMRKLNVWLYDAYQYRKFCIVKRKRLT